MNIGDLNTLVTIEHEVVKADDLTGSSAKWGTWCKCWCSFASEGGGESTPNQDQVQASTIHTVETHWSPAVAAITAKMRAVLPDGRILGIRSVVNDKMQNRKLVLTLEELS